MTEGAARAIAFRSRVGPRGAPILSGRHHRLPLSASCALGHFIWVALSSHHRQPASCLCGLVRGGALAYFFIPDMLPLLLISMAFTLLLIAPATKLC